MALDLKQPASVKIVALDILRGAAALAIAWYHSRSDLWIGFKAIHHNPSDYSAFNRVISYASLPVSQAGSMVVIFFILSGFCIHLPHAVIGRSLKLKSYSVRRLVRVYPAYAVVVIGCLLVALGLFWPVTATSEELNIYAASFALMQNWLHDGKQIALNESLWTIPIEVEAYVFYPFLLLIWRRFGIASALCLSLSATLVSIILFVNGFSIVKFTFLPYLIVWFLGAWIAESYARNRLPEWKSIYALLAISGATLVIVSGLLGLDTFWLTYGWGFVAVFVMLWIVGSSQLMFEAHNLWVKPLATLGTISYSIYLVHVPFFKVLGFFWILYFGNKPVSFLVPSFATLLVIPVAYAFYKFIEQPSHQLARHLGKF